MFDVTSSHSITLSTGLIYNDFAQSLIENVYILKCYSVLSRKTFSIHWFHSMAFPFDVCFNHRHSMAYVTGYCNCGESIAYSNTELW